MIVPLAMVAALCLGPGGPASQTTPGEPVPRPSARDVETWSKYDTIRVQAGYTYLQGTGGAKWEESQSPYISVTYARPIARWLLVAPGVGVHTWETALAEVWGYPRRTTVHASLTPELRRGFGARGRGGMLFRFPVGLTTNFAPTPRDVGGVRERAGLGYGWHAGGGFGFFVFPWRKLGFTWSLWAQATRFRHRWRFESDDGELSWREDSDVIRYRFAMIGGQLGFVLAR